MAIFHRQHLLRCLLAIVTVIAWLAGAFAGDGVADRKAVAASGSVIFRGAWFDVRYPAGFIPRPSLESSTAEGYDSAEFISPDGTVSFYVFAPQWGGTAVDIALLPDQERLVAEQRRKTGGRQIRWYTIAARDGSYRRSYQEAVSRQGSVKTIVGIKYRDEEARLRYQKAYQRFRNSLKLYAD